jgi:hypothetical protein
MKSTRETRNFDEKTSLKMFILKSEKEVGEDMRAVLTYLWRMLRRLEMGRTGSGQYPVAVFSLHVLLQKNG